MDLFLGRPRGRRHQLDALDGLRGLAVLIVLASHLSNAGLHLFPGFTLTGTGKSGVYLFFVLSAFLLTRILMDRPAGDYGTSRLWLDYALRRILRIWPLYLVVLVLSWGLTAGGVAGWHYVMDGPAFWRHLSLREGQSVLWSIPVEFKYYFFLPLVALALAWLRARKPGWLVEIALVLALLAAASWTWPGSEARPNDVRLGPYLVIFLCGAIAARIDLALQARPEARGPAAWTGLSLAAALALIATIPSVWAPLTGSALEPALNHAWFLFFGLAWSALLLGVLHGHAWLRKPFAWKPLRWVGAVSFSLYLWHMPVFDGLRLAGAGDWVMAPLWLLAAALGVAAISYLLLERPWRDVRVGRATPKP